MSRSRGQREFGFWARGAETHARPPQPSLPLGPNAARSAVCAEGLSSPRSGGSAAHRPVSAVVLSLQQGLVSKSSLKWLCLSSLLLYELKQKQNKNQPPTTINTKTLTHQTLAACVTHKPHQYSVKKLILLKTIHSTRDQKVAVVSGHAACPGRPTVRCFLKNQGVTVTRHRTAKPSQLLLTPHTKYQGEHKKELVLILMD